MHLWPLCRWCHHSRSRRGGTLEGLLCRNTHDTHTLCEMCPPTSSHCLFPSYRNPANCSVGIGRERTRAEHKVDGYSTDRRTLTCLHAPVTLTYSHLQFSFRSSPSENTSSMRLPKWRGELQHSTDCSHHGACLVSPLPQIHKQTAIHTRFPLLSLCSGRGGSLIRLYLVSVFQRSFKKRDSTRAVTSAGERHL